MWYTYLNRNQHYLRSYRTHNLWFRFDALKARTPRVHGFVYGALKRIAKTYSGVSFTWIKTLPILTLFNAYLTFNPPFYRLVTLDSSTVLPSSLSLSSLLASLLRLRRTPRTTSSTTDSFPSSARTSSVTTPGSCPTSIFS